MLADGTYRLATPLHFTVLDGGQHSHVVRWQASEDAHPVVSGGVAVTGWTPADRARDISVATVPRGLDPRQLDVGTRLARRAHVQAPRTPFAFTTTGITIVAPKWHFLASLPDQSRIEVEQTGFFTGRRARVDRISGETLWMQQRGWRNNLIGYDTVAGPWPATRDACFSPMSPALLLEPGQFFIDPESGEVYYKRLQAVLPRLGMLVSIAGSYDRPVTDLDFVGIAFRQTSWLGSSSAEGYASRQSGSYLAGWIPDFPSDPIRDCSRGCWAFETMRNRWQQQPAAVQVPLQHESRSTGGIYPVGADRTGNWQ